MTSVFTVIENGPVWIAGLVLLVAFAVLSKGADLFVESAVAMAERMRIPKLIIGIALVSVATTAPEVSVSLVASLHGQPEMAMGNAVGSVICNCGLALALCAVISAKPIPVLPFVLKVTGSFLAGIAGVAFLLVAFDYHLGRVDGAILLIGFAGYIVYMIRGQRRGKIQADVDLEPFEDDIALPLRKLVVLFIVGLAAIILSSRFIVVSAVAIARYAGIPEAVIALSLVALGTSIPEVATSVMSARKGHGDLCIGNILGANIMNICLVAGGASLVSGLTIEPQKVFFMFPAMFVMLGITLLVLRTHHKLSRKEGFLLCSVYLVYLGTLVFLT